MLSWRMFVFVMVFPMLVQPWASDDVQGVELSPIVLHPDYRHDRIYTQPKDIVKHFRAYAASFEGDAHTIPTDHPEDMETQVVFIASNRRQAGFEVASSGEQALINQQLAHIPAESFKEALLKVQRCLVAAHNEPRQDTRDPDEYDPPIHTR